MLRFVKPEPVFTCHWYVVAFDAVTVKVALLPAPMLALLGWLVIDGAGVTVKLALFDVAAGATAPLATTRYK
ncbi:hypothetical protein D3C84_1126050 [compost metagenome]